MGGKARKKGWNRKNNSERSKLSSGEDYCLARFTRQLLLLLFFANTEFFSFSPNVDPGPKLRGWLYLQGSTAFVVSTGNGVYTKMVPVLSVTIIIAY